jgi:transposase
MVVETAGVPVRTNVNVSPREVSQAILSEEDNVDSRRLQQIPGISPILALTILAEASDLRRFAHHRQFLKFCGLDLSTRQPGQFRGTTNLSKYGNTSAVCLLSAPTLASRGRYRTIARKSSGNVFMASCSACYWHNMFLPAPP